MRQFIYIYDVDLTWVWSVWGALTITCSIMQSSKWQTKTKTKTNLSLSKLFSYCQFYLSPRADISVWLHSINLQWQYKVWWSFESTPGVHCSSSFSQVLPSGRKNRPCPFRPFLERFWNRDHTKRTSWIASTISIVQVIISKANSIKIVLW